MFSNFRAGDRVSVAPSFPDYPSDEFVLTVAIRGPASLDLTATGVGNGYSLGITAEESAQLPAGEYFYQAIADDGAGDLVTVSEGRFKVGENLAAIEAPYDGRSETEKMLESVNKAIMDLTDSNCQEYKIKDREFTKQDLPNLIVWRDVLRIEVYRARQAAQVGQGISRNTLQARFS